MHHIRDERVKQLVDTFEGFGAAVQNDLNQILSGSKEQKSFSISKLSRTLEEAKRAFFHWSETEVGKSAPDAPRQDVVLLVNNAKLAVTTALTSISISAISIARAQNERSIPSVRKAVSIAVRRGKSADEAANAALTNLRNSFGANPVTVIADSGRSRKFSLPYYVAMVGDMVIKQAKTIGVIALARKHGIDLVRVSKQKSDHADFCDAFSGKVFSLSGRDVRVTAYEKLPNGGPPFHPWCEHELVLFDAEGMALEEIEAYGFVESRFLLQHPKDTANRISAAWEKAKTEPKDEFAV